MIEDNRIVPSNASSANKKRRRARMFAWWYVCIGAAFVLLGVRSVLRSDPIWAVGIRFVIAIGFAVLAAGTFRGYPR
jgi:protein-S-isoprenylcysteine O-methyltransferase Ste14